MSWNNKQIFAAVALPINSCFIMDDECPMFCKHLFCKVWIKCRIPNAFIERIIFIFVKKVLLNK